MGNKMVRLGGIIAIAVVILGAFGWYKATGYRDAAREQAYRQADEQYQQTMKGADRIGEQAKADLAEAERLRSQARELREQPAAPAPSQITRAQAIENDAFIMALLDRHPELKSPIMNGTTAMNPTIQLMVSQGQLEPSDVAYISRFSKSLQDLPR